MTTESIVTLLHRYGVPVATPGSPEYADATSPENSSVVQAPAAVARPSTAAGVGAAVRAAAEAGLVVAVQSTGHGAGRALDDGTLLIDTKDLARIDIDSETETATVGSGAVWGDVQKAAEKRRMLGLAGTSPRVGVSGYTFGGGVGWLTRPHGLASGALRSVEFVDGAGLVRTAADDAADETDRDAIRAFRGGQPVGIATALTFDLVSVPDLYAGYLLWPLADAEAVVAAWASALEGLPQSITSTIALLQLPPEGPFPDDLLGSPVVHLSFASPDGEASCAGLLAAVREAAPPAVDTAGPCDAERLSGIHLDPPPGNPSLGDGRWLGEGSGTASAALAILQAAHVGEADGLMMMELRHLASTAGGLEGSLTVVPAPFLWQGIGRAGDALQRSITAAALARVTAATTEVGADVGRGYASFRTGYADPADAFTDDEAVWLPRTAATTDPAALFRFERTASTRA